MDTSKTNQETIENIEQVNSARAGFYRTLASLFYRELTASKIEELSGIDFSAFDCGDELMNEGYALIAHELRRPDGSTRQRLACDYAHTFLAAGNYDDHMATPYESVFTSEDGLLMQEARDDVYRMYCAEHVGLPADNHEPEDHLTFELEFMAVLADRMNEALADGNFGEAHRLAAVSRDFHTRHLESWIDNLCDGIDRVAETRFYRGVSKITRGFVHMDDETIEEIDELLAALAESKAVA